MSAKKNDKKLLNATPAIDRKMGVWKTQALLAAQVKAKCELARDAITKLIVASGAEVLVSKFGTIPLATITTESVDWEALARAHLTGAQIEKALPHFTSQKTSAPFIKAPSGWSAEAKAA